MSFSGKVVLITGASSGIGAATAIAFAKDGASVTMVGRNEEKLNKVAQECEAAGKKPLVIKADVSVDEEAKRIVKETVEHFGKLDILVNNAGFARMGSILEGNVVEAYDSIMATNVRAVINLTTLCAPYLVETKGNIVNVSSGAGQAVPIVPSFIGYHVSKAALDHFSRGAALELAPHGVRVNVVSPGPVKTDFRQNSGLSELKMNTYSIPLNRVGESEEIADLILFVASDKAKSITGSNFLSDNGVLLTMGRG